MPFASYLPYTFILRQIKKISRTTKLKGEVMKITDSKSLGQSIRARRKELGYTQKYLSEYTGLSITFISQLERGKPTAEIEKTIQLIHILGMDLMIEKR